MAKLTIDMFSDVVCPWCYLGERRLTRAAAARPDIELELRWRPFQLHVGMPKGVDWRSFAEMKFGSLERWREMSDRVAELGAAEGVEFRFDRIASAPNTVDAHRTILLAGPPDRQRAVADALFRAYFAQGRDLNDRDVLAGAAAEAGLDRDAIRAALDGAAAEADVETSQTEAERLGINGVPFFILNGQWALSGAQPSEVWEQVFDQVVGADAAVDERFR